MENYADKAFPTKAGVYAVREGPVITRNIINFIKKQPLETYVPQDGFLSLMMTGDGGSIGSKFGICFVGKWVWQMKDIIDMAFMDLFNPKYLFEDYENSGDSKPIDKPVKNAEKTKYLEEAKKSADEMTATEAAKVLGCAADETAFEVRLAILTRMHFEEEFRNEVVSKYDPPYKI